jgi:RND family efflux transporter MFP subunit
LADIEKKIIINGDVLAGREVSVFPNTAGRLSALRLKVGDTAARGQIIALVDPAKPGEVFSQSPVAAPISGTILSAPVSVGGAVSASTAVYTIGDISDCIVETFVPERFVMSVRKGLAAEIALEAVEGETFAAFVDEISPVLDPASRSLRIRLKFARRDSRIRAGMFARISLVTNSRTGVKSIPRDALINTYGAYIVFTVDEKGRARRREIELGLESETLVEIRNGLEAGETVVIAGQNFLTDGDPARIVE